MTQIDKSSLTWLSLIRHTIETHMEMKTVVLQ